MTSAELAKMSDEDLLKTLEEEAKDRYTESDNEYPNLKLSEEDRTPPVVPNWSRPQLRDGERTYKRGRYDSGDRDGGRSWDRDRDRWGGRSGERYGDRRDGYGHSNRQEYGSYGRHSY